jgi:TRAP-type mannitol/chloroaromatic compound transport system permease large subunit
MVFLILVGATAFSLVFRGVHGDRLLTQFILESNFEPYQFLAIAMLVIFILGFFIDFIEITFIIVPVIAPILVQMGYDLLWVGILIAMNLQTSFLTPPFGFSIFYLKGVAPPGVTTSQLYKGVIPYVVLQLGALILIILFPEISFWLLKIIGS